MTEYSPGPWRSEGPDEFGDYNILHNGDPRAVAVVVSNMRPPDEVRANARLIAAVCGLYEALDDLLSEWFDADDTGTQDDPFVARARRALAEARGEEA